MKKSRSPKFEAEVIQHTTGFKYELTVHMFLRHTNRLFFLIIQQICFRNLPLPSLVYSGLLPAPTRIGALCLSL